jgi:predicted dehydrogenase
MGALLAEQPDVVIVAVTHDALCGLAEQALAGGAHVLIEKPAGLGVAQIDRLIAAAEHAQRMVKVGFNHRFHPALRQAAAEVHSLAHGALLHLRGRYGHGGRVGYEREWRAKPLRSGGGELVDQGMHLIDLTHWLSGALPLHCGLLRTQYWPMEVEDNAALILGDGSTRSGPWAMLHVTWTEWKNLFSLEIYCERAKVQVDGLGGSYGPETLRIYRMGPELGPPTLEETVFAAEDVSWSEEWENLAGAIAEADGQALNGDLADARYAWSVIEDAYSAGPFAAMRADVGRAVLG